MELPKELKPTLVDLSELDHISEILQPSTTTSIDYASEVKKLMLKDKYFNPDASGTFREAPSEAGKTLSADANNLRRGKNIVLVIISIIVIGICWYVFRRQKRVQEKLREKIDSNSSSNYFDSVRASDLSRNVFGGAEVLIYLFLAFGFVVMIGKIAKASDSIVA